MSGDEMPLSGGREPSLGGQRAIGLSGMEPELGGVRRVKPDPHVVAAVLGSDDERQAAIAYVQQRGLGRVYALELVKIISSSNVRRMHGNRWGYAYSTAQRINATRALEAFGQDVGVEALVDALGDRAWWVGQYAIDALAAVGRPALERVSGALEDRSPVVRRRAADVLGLIGDRQATEPLVKAAGDEISWVRTRAVHALGLLRDSRAVPALRRALQDDDPLVVRAAVEALRQIGLPEAPPLAESA